MQITISPTPEFFMAGDVMVRMWTGTDQNGNHLVALVTAVGFSGQAEDIAEGLVSIPPPDEAEARRWAEEVMSGRPFKEDKDALD
jgi:hypothetical protein